MLLHRIHLNPRSKDVRRDLADPYQMHATLCRAFFPEAIKCPPGALLWRLEPETDAAGYPRVLVQSRLVPDWSRLLQGWLVREADMPKALRFDWLKPGMRLRFRLRANPCKTVASKRQGLMQREAQMAWIRRKAGRHGFTLSEPATADYFEFMAQPTGHAYSDCRVTHEQMLTGRKQDGMIIRIYAVLYEGQLEVTDPEVFQQALTQGVGHGKAMGLGLLSVAPARG